MKTTIKVWELYKQAKESGMKLLPEYSEPFWAVYVDNANRFDRVFNMLYKSFSYDFSEYPNETVDTSEKLKRFKDDVEVYLIANKKRYEELFRLENISDDDYSILNNYDMKETMDRFTSETGEQNKGQQENNSTISDSAYTDIKENALGKQHSTSSINTGQQENTTTHGVAPYDSAETNIESKDDTTIGSRADSVDSTTDAYTDTETIDGGERQRTQTAVEGERKDTDKKDGTENYTLTRAGNIGVMTQTEVMRQHDNFWRDYEFILRIFADISRYCLILVD